ncbi:MAG TPA: M48 family metallopeptidase [Candidatus Nitrosotalea sp.]|nr:M48 family metallopeptidase [Candidatus Nitrosotalea sp.]
MRTDWQGVYLDGRTAARRPATIRLMREGLEITPAGGATRLWPYRELRQTQGFYAGEEVRLERGGELPETLLVPDVAFLESLQEMAPHAGSRFHDPRRRGARLRWTIVAGVGVLATAAAIYLWGIPALAALAAPRVPVAWEESVGRSAIAYLAPPERRCGDPELGRVMDETVRRLTTPGPPSPYTFRVHVVNRPLVNALAVPGGYVVVFRGLLERASTPEELAGVMAHELQHVLHRHATRAVIQDVSTGLLIMALTGDVTGPLAYGLQTARTLGELRYSRRAEEEADTDGMKMLLAARVDPAGMITFFEQIQKEEGPAPKALTYLSTHPLAADRIARLRAMAAAWKGTPVPLLPGEKWPDLVKRC